MNRFINDPSEFVNDYLVGLAETHYNIVRHDAARQFISRAEVSATDKVGIISGGGSGCEPLHTGFVGYGMLDAACPGEIFTSPVPDQIVAATKAVDRGAGLVHIVKNFSGEIMNFGMAQDILAFDDIAVEQVVINDDVATKAGMNSADGRGLGATIVAEKIAGAAAERGDDLKSVVDIACRVNEKSRSFGVGLSSCTLPSLGRPANEMEDGKMDLGIGISGEPGQERIVLGSAREIAMLLVDKVVTSLRPQKGKPMLAVVNGLGGTPPSELYLLYGKVQRALRDAGLVPTRAIVGNYMTALDQKGAALTLLELDSELLKLWDAPVCTAALRWGM